MGARPNVCGSFFMFLMFVLTLADGLCRAWFVDLIMYWCWKHTKWWINSLSNPIFDFIPHKLNTA
jgi:hypothetical protein